MFAPLNRWARLALSAAVAAVLPTLAGCDSPADQADRKAAADVQAAEDSLRTKEDLSDSIQHLQTAIGNAEAGPITRLRANSLLGQLLARQAADDVRQVERIDRDALRLAMEIAQLASQAQLAGQLSTGYKLLDPTPIVNNLSKQADDARGGADRPIWFETDGVKFGTLATVSNEVSKQQGVVAELQQQMQALQVQRDSALAAAEASAKEAETAAGRASVDAYIKSSNAKKQASDLGTQLDTLNSKLEFAKRELAIVESRKQYVAGAAKQLEEGGSSLQASWVTLQKAAATQTELVKSITAGTGSAVTLEIPEGSNINVEALPGGSITEKANKLVEISKKADTQREEVLTKLNEASEKFANAIAAADAARSEVEKRKAEPAGASEAQKKVWDIAQNDLAAAVYRVGQADVLRAIASQQAARAASLDVRIKLQDFVATSLKGTGTNPPESLTDAQLQTQYEEALKAADAKFKEADDLLETVMSGGQRTDSERAAGEAAKVSRIFGLYRWANVAGDMGAAEQAKGHLDMARSIVADMSSAGAQLPSLPPELSSAVVAPAKGDSQAAPKDATQPSTEPAAPAEQPAGDKPVEKPPEGQGPG